jgi:hypothetical protein
VVVASGCCAGAGEGPTGRQAAGPLRPLQQRSAAVRSRGDNGDPSMYTGPLLSGVLLAAACALPGSCCRLYAMRYDALYPRTRRCPCACTLTTSDDPSCGPCHQTYTYNPQPHAAHPCPMRMWKRLAAMCRSGLQAPSYVVCSVVCYVCRYFIVCISRSRVMPTAGAAG